MRVGYLDDDNSNVRKIQRLASKSKKIEIIPLELNEEIEMIINEIYEKKLNGIIVDYNFSDKRSDVSFNGVDVINEIEDKLDDFPSFILTSFDEDAENEFVDVNKIYTKEQYYKHPDILNRRVFKQVENYIIKIEESKERILELNLAKEVNQLTLKEEEELIELDNHIEKSISKINQIPSTLKETSNFERLNLLLQKAEELLEKVKKYD